MAMKSEMGKKSRAAKPLTTKSFVAATPVVASARTLGPRAFSIAINKRKSIPERPLCVCTGAIVSRRRWRSPGGNS